jgi:hypothetical protein
MREEYRQIEIKEGSEEIINKEDNKEDDIKEELTGLISNDNKDEDEDEDEDEDKNGDEDEDDVNRCNKRNRCSLLQNRKGIVRTNALPLLKGYVRTP